jgi:protein TonB
MPEGVSDAAVGYDMKEVSFSAEVLPVNGITTISVVEEEDESEEMIFTVVENDPEFPGGMDSLRAFIQRNIRYPEAAWNQKIEGKVFVTFTVETDGSITNIKVLRDIGGGCGQEAVRVVSIMPKWKPGTQRGKPVRVQYNLPIVFQHPTNRVK